MARITARCLSAFLAVACTLLFTAAAAQTAGLPAPASAAPAMAAPAPPAFSAPTRPAPNHPGEYLWPVVRLYNTDYVDLRDLAKRYGLKTVWEKRDEILRLEDATGVLLRFESHNRDFHLEGVRIFMGETAVYSRGSLFISKIDLIKTILPLLNPGEHANQLPPPPRLIVLDPGHGGSDPGKQNLTLHLNEKDMTLDVALRLKKLLESRGYRVLLTRSDDRYVELDQRPWIATQAKADLFVSIHFNALPLAVAATVSGTETYSMTPQFMLSTTLENDKTMRGTSYAGNKQDYANTILSFVLHRQIIRELKTSDRGLKRYRLAVLRSPECPAVLIESAFLSNNVEGKKVGTPEFRQQIAAAMADGIDAYSALLARLHPPAAPETHPAPATPAPATPATAAPVAPVTTPPATRSAAPAPSPR